MIVALNLDNHSFIFKYMLTCFESLKRPNGFIPLRRYNFKFPTGKWYSTWVSSRIGRHVSGDLYSHSPNQYILCGLIIFWSRTIGRKAFDRWNHENPRIQGRDRNFVFSQLRLWSQLILSKLSKLTQRTD